jgi:hypothetical protein
MSTIIKFLIASLMVVYTANASEWRLNLNNPSGHNSFRYSNSSIFKPGHRPNHRPNHRPQQPIHKPGYKPGHKPIHKPRHGWYGAPYYLPRYNTFRRGYYGYGSYGGGGSSDNENVIVKEREIIKEVPVYIQPPAPERVWVEPVYEKQTIEGHYEASIVETIDANGVRTFKNNGVGVWLPKTTGLVLVKPGYWK